MRMCGVLGLHAVRRRSPEPSGRRQRSGLSRGLRLRPRRHVRQLRSCPGEMYDFHARNQRLRHLHDLHDLLLHAGGLRGRAPRARPGGAGPVRHPAQAARSPATTRRRPRRSSSTACTDFCCAFCTPVAADANSSAPRGPSAPACPSQRLKSQAAASCIGLGAHGCRANPVDMPVRPLNPGGAPRRPSRIYWSAQRAACGPCWRSLTPARAVAARLPSSKNPVLVLARVMTAWAAPSPSSNRALVLRLMMVSQAWW
jgi:hypothetical protein